MPGNLISQFCLGLKFPLVLRDFSLLTPPNVFAPIGANTTGHPPARKNLRYSDIPLPLPGNWPSCLRSRNIANQPRHSCLPSLKPRSHRLSVPLACGREAIRLPERLFDQSFTCIPVGVRNEMVHLVISRIIMSFTDPFDVSFPAQENSIFLIWQSRIIKIASSFSRHHRNDVNDMMMGYSYQYS